MNGLFSTTVLRHPEGASGGGGAQEQTQQAPAAGQATQTEPTQSTQQVQQPAFDYEKLAGILAGRQAQNEESVLKGYFKQQGLSQEEMAQAIAAFKDQKAKNTPDVSALQSQLQASQAVAQRYMVESAATTAAINLGIDAKTIPYVIKMADMTKVVGSDGKINQEELTNALNKVLEDVPQLKPQAQTRTGFVQVGSVVNPQQPASGSTGAKDTPSKRWNRFNH